MSSKTESRDYFLCLSMRSYLHRGCSARVCVWVCVCWQALPSTHLADNQTARTRTASVGGPLSLPGLPLLRGREDLGEYNNLEF